MKVWRPLFLDHALGLGGFVRPDVVFRKGLVDHLEAHLDGHFVRGGAVLAQQKFEHEHRHVGAHLDFADQILAHHLAGEDPVDLIVQGVPFRKPFPMVFHHRVPNFTLISLDWARTRSVAGSWMTTCSRSTSSISRIMATPAFFLGCRITSPFPARTRPPWPCRPCRRSPLC